MCEFDTLSESGEVLSDIYSIIQLGFKQVLEARIANDISGSRFIYLLRVILNNLRGLFEGVYRSKQFMWLLNEMLGSEIFKFI